MKTRIYYYCVALFALALLAFGQVTNDKPMKPSPGEVRTMTLENPIADSGSLTVKSGGTNSGFSLTMPEPKVGNVVFSDLLTITGIEYRMMQPPPEGAGLFFIRGPKTERPEKPEEITAILYTKDGKRWRAKWVEDVVP